MKAAVYFGSREIYYDMVASYKSLLINSDVDKVYLLIEDKQFPFELHPDVSTINISTLVPKLFNPDSPNYGSNWTYIGLIRAALSKVFYQYDRILSIDCDTVVTGDISELWDIDLEDYYVAGVKEPILSERRGYLYINAGVTMWNLKKLREDGMDDQMIYRLNTNKYTFVSQDVLNEECKGHILELSPEYNVSSFTEKCYVDAKVQHFAGGIPRHWRELEIVKYYREIPPVDIRQGRR